MISEMNSEALELNQLQSLHVLHYMKGKTKVQNQVIEYAPFFVPHRGINFVPFFFLLRQRADTVYTKRWGKQVNSCSYSRAEDIRSIPPSWSMTSSYRH